MNSAPLSSHYFSLGRSGPSHGRNANPIRDVLYLDEVRYILALFRHLCIDCLLKFLFCFCTHNKIYHDLHSLIHIIRSLIPLYPSHRFNEIVSIAIVLECFQYVWYCIEYRRIIPPSVSDMIGSQRCKQQNVDGEQKVYPKKLCDACST